MADHNQLQQSVPSVREQANRVKTLTGAARLKGCALDAAVARTSDGPLVLTIRQQQYRCVGPLHD